MSKRMTKGAAGELYQVAGQLLLIPETLTKGQRDRLGVLILDVLSEPHRFTGKTVADLRRLALEE